MITVDKLYQWDLNRTVTVNDAADEMHWQQPYSSMALRTSIVDGKANIPNIVLQQHGKIKCWSYDSANGRTVNVYEIDISRRQKPDNYVYTETEVITVEQYVNDYLANGQVQFSWNKITDKPNLYSKEEVDAITGGLQDLVDAHIDDADTIMGDLRDLADAHIDDDINTEAGVHGLRWYNDVLQFFNGTDWIEIETGGGGVPPSNVINPSIIVGDSQLTIKWDDPEDIVVDGQLISTWAGTKLVRKAGSFPTSPSDGVVLVDNKVRGAYASTGFVDSGLTNGTTYYYQLFPYNDLGAANKNTANRLSAAPQAYKIYGVAIDLTNSNPETAVTYTDDAVGVTGGAAAWDSMNIFKDIKPCLLKNGVVQYYLNPNDFTKKADGSAADITSGNDGDVMIEIPKTGFSITTNGNYIDVKVTDNPNNAAFKYYAHTRSAEGDRSKLYIGAYLGWNSGGKLRSLSGKTPTDSQTIGTFRNQAQANGAGYDIVSFYPLTLLQCLFLIKYKNRDSQTALGRGFVDGNSGSVATGGTNTKGIDFGETTGKQQMCFLNIEDMWGNLRWFIDGFFSDASRNMLTAFTGFNDTGSGYTNRGQGATANIANFMSKPQGTTEAGFVAKEVGGSATTHFTDDASLHASRLPNFGGSWSSGDFAGVFYLRVSIAADNSGPNYGARLMYL